MTRRRLAAVAVLAVAVLAVDALAGALYEPPATPVIYHHGYVR